MHVASNRSSLGILGGAVLAFTAFGLTGCSAVETLYGSGAEPRQHEVDSNAEFVAGGSAEENLAYFTKQADDYSKSNSPIEGRSIVDHFVAAGFDKTAMQVSLDKTALSDNADSIFASVRINSQCLIAQFEVSDRTYQVDIAPVLLAGESGYCLIGETRPIDW
ncbi:DUF6993 domain-containing protein [Canibacter zhoujuaniae]|uniref:DUF6993 domain-containing protein n=1 Tax=Canibacter zhoujuaniae TaxID=2708343 RepID=UPI0014236B02|nr:hypothetical protein [Canibacter zhoujuaniae]